MAQLSRTYIIRLQQAAVALDDFAAWSAESDPAHGYIYKNSVWAEIPAYGKPVEVNVLSFLADIGIFHSAKFNLRKISSDWNYPLKWVPNFQSDFPPQTDPDAHARASCEAFFGLTPTQLQTIFLDPKSPEACAAAIRTFLSTNLE